MLESDLLHIMQACTDAVSYTHLDVYKRQVYRSLFCLSVLLDSRKRGFGKWFVKWQ